ncbi:MAG: ATP-binding protein [Planctomycetes bacterium]|nr:ATP-binding protein [Planctomycetota bacterium]
MSTPLPTWASDLITAYESGATAQFILAGNVHDRMVLPQVGDKGAGEMGSLNDFLIKVMLPRFDVVFSYDLGNGLRVERGGEIIAKWPRMKENPSMPRGAREAVDTVTHYLRYVANLERLGQGRVQVGVLIRSADLIVPAESYGQAEPSAIASLIRDWASDGAIADHAVATFLTADNLTDLHPLVAANPRATAVRIPLPTAKELEAALTVLAPKYPKALSAFVGKLATPAGLLAGTTLAAVEGLLKTREHQNKPLVEADLLSIKKSMVERECGGLIEFIESSRTLNDYEAGEAIKTWLRQDVQLWKQGDLQAMPMGYLLCGPVGTGKTYLVECLAGEAGVPVVKLKNFRDKWVGSTEANLEKIFRLIHALGRCFVFVDEADQALGKRDQGAGDSGGIGGRVYAMMAEEMSNGKNRGKIVWILASSRPDLIEIDLKRPGRIDVRIPIFPTTTAEQGLKLLRALGKRRGLVLTDEEGTTLLPLVPDLLTPGAAEALAVKAYRISKTANRTAIEAMRDCLTGYQSPVPKATMEYQIGLAIAEASDPEFVPAGLRSSR